jgi:hypothetical protein
MEIVVSQIPSALLSFIALQFPHHPLNVPFTSGLVKPASPFMFKRNVTLKADN